MIAAFLVLFSHCFTLTTGNSALEPGRQQLGMTLGDISVDIFFVMSGFLVSKSLLRSRSLRSYSLARAFRIFPGLWVALALTTVAVCVGFSTVSALENAVDPDVWHYFVKNAVVVTGTAFGFAGAFAYNPYPRMVNASLWTLPLEVWMYIILGCAWALARFVRTGSPRGFVIGVRIIAALLICTTFALDSAGHTSNSLRHATVFFLAAALQGAEERVSLRWTAFIAMLALVLATAALAPHAFEYAYRLLLPYLVLFVAFVPGGPIRRYNALGDYSYGIYIYAFPVQQMVADTMPGIGIASMFLLSGIATLALAVLSWHVVEKRAMGWRTRWDRRAAAH